MRNFALPSTAAHVLLLNIRCFRYLSLSLSHSHSLSLALPPPTLSLSIALPHSVSHTKCESWSSLRSHERCFFFFFQTPFLSFGLRSRIFNLCSVFFSQIKLKIAKLPNLRENSSWAKNEKQQKVSIWLLSGFFELLRDPWLHFFHPLFTLCWVGQELNVLSAGRS